MEVYQGIWRYISDGHNTVTTLFDFTDSPNDSKFFKECTPPLQSEEISTSNAKVLNSKKNLFNTAILIFVT